MRKNKFLQELRKRLIVLNDEEIESIIEEYRNLIQNKIDEGMSETDAINDFGDIDNLAKEILNSYKVNEKYQGKKTINNSDGFVNKVIDFFQKIVEAFSNKKGEDLANLIIKFVLIIVGVSLLKFPFYLITELGFTIFTLFPDMLGVILFKIFKVIIELIYVGVSLFLMYKFVNKYIIDDANLMKEKREKSEIKKEETRRKPGIMSVVLKVFLFILAFPFIGILAGLCLTLGILVTLCLKGIYLVSIFLIIIGLIVMTSSIIGLIFSIEKEF